MGDFDQVIFGYEMKLFIYRFRVVVGLKGNRKSRMYRRWSITQKRNEILTRARTWRNPKNIMFS